MNPTQTELDALTAWAKQLAEGLENSNSGAIDVARRCMEAINPKALASIQEQSDG